MKKKLLILGVRGIPAKHGGFETFVEKLALYLVDRGWSVTVYCQEDAGDIIWESTWNNVVRIHVPSPYKGPFGTVLFDLKATLHALSQRGLFLTLGYNTALFNVLQRLKGQVNLINMDGIEWRRSKWGIGAKIWFWFNERIACLVGNHLIADHPHIKNHLATRISSDKISMIPYGGDEVISSDVRVLDGLGLVPGKFSTVIARPEPENSLLEIVRAFSSKYRNHKLVVLGHFDFQDNAYHSKIQAAASSEVLFPGAIYDYSLVQALRFFSLLYLHGHQVGGTNPSLVEAMGAGCAVIARDNSFNRWVAGPGASYFYDEMSCSQLLDTLLDDRQKIECMKASSRKRFQKGFKWEIILKKYELLLNEWYPTY